MTQHDDDKNKLNTTEARQGETSGHMRTVLVVSLTLAVVCLALWFMIWR
ncbi:MAG: hypothetical protein KJ904_01225 [Alphaproteobacteria bacterium]|nr:hypothetical protein [Alphaproteobacteria bacterium]MBU0796084.1 hypothetical protein [Alphaproteobacteria bacterium]MBU0885765.1 hypothetical protein [Alphaproteobacteria bacterium]MBU1814468.1 hypothetical protein [Alphaproteobacteria bacterium]